jgi:peroxiredoxin
MGLFQPPARGGCVVHPDLAVGKQFPDLELPDHQAKPVRLSALAGEFPLIVSFYRGYW